MIVGNLKQETKINEITCFCKKICLLQEGHVAMKQYLLNKTAVEDVMDVGPFEDYKP